MENKTFRQESQTIPRDEARRLVYFAAERTLMAWIRTALGLLALGFVIDRFGLVLRDNVTSVLASAQHSRIYSFWGGEAMVIIGAIMAVVAAIRYWLFAHNYRRHDSTQTGHGIMLGVMFTLVIAFLGFVVAGYLLFPLLST